MDLAALLLFTNESGASDLHLSAGAPPMVRVKGEMRQVSLPDTPPGTPLSAMEVQRLVYDALSEHEQKVLERDLELDCALTLGGTCRFRANVFLQQRGIAAVFRIIPAEIKAFDDLGLPDAVRDLASRDRGLVLVTGPTGSGKSTTLAAMVDWINENRQGHIITIEDPIEFVHRPKSCMINQRELGTNTRSFANALRSCLREDPDVILVGEMRDLETIALAITAAETGHLVFGTLHTNNASKTIDRVINVFPTAEQEQIRAMLAESLMGVVSQHLLPRADGSGRVAAHEILISTNAVRAMIRDGKTYTLPNAIQTGARSGMQSLEQSLTRLAAAGAIENRLVQCVLAGESTAGEDVRSAGGAGPGSGSAGGSVRRGKTGDIADMYPDARSPSGTVGATNRPGRAARGGRLGGSRHGR